MTQRDDWTELAGLAQNGDKAAYGRLLREIAPYIRSVALKSLNNPEGAEDLVQEVLISVHKALPSYSPDRPFMPWLMAIFNFRRTDWLRQYYSRQDHKKVSADVLDWSQKGPVTNPAHAGELKDIEHALDALPPMQKKLFMMMRLEGFTAQEIALQTGMSVTAVKVSVHRTTQKLKERLSS